MKNSTIKNDLLDLFELEELAPEGNLQLPTPSLVSYYKDKKDRVIWIDKDIDGTLFEEIRMILQYNREDANANIAPEDRMPIRLMVHSYGGTLDSAFALLDVMKISKTPIYTYNLNACMSAGAMIFINGHKRFSMPMSTVLFHNGSGGAGGTFDQVVAQTENYKRLMKMLQDNILEHTTISKSYLSKQLKKEWYLYLDEQQKYGVTDEVITDISQIIG